MMTELSLKCTCHSVDWMVTERSPNGAFQFSRNYGVSPMWWKNMKRNLTGYVWCPIQFKCKIWFFTCRNIDLIKRHWNCLRLQTKAFKKLNYVCFKFQLFFSVRINRACATLDIWTKYSFQQRERELNHPQFSFFNPKK